VDGQEEREYYSLSRRVYDVFASFYDAVAFPIRGLRRKVASRVELRPGVRLGSRTSLGADHGGAQDGWLNGVSVSDADSAAALFSGRGHRVRWHRLGRVHHLV